MKPHPFDRHARSYAETWGADPIAAHLRARVHEVVVRFAQPGARLLDAGCGIGIDTQALGLRGFDVLGVDASEGMIAEARRRVPAATFEVRALEDLSRESSGTFGAALSNFGVLNCVPLFLALAGLAQVLEAGAPLIAVVMPRIHPSFLLRELKHGRPMGALRRFERTVVLPLSDGDRIPTTYLSPHALIRAAAPWFEPRHVESLGLLLPPPGSGPWSDRTLALLSRAEDRVRALPGLRDVGDHVVVVLTRTPGASVTSTASAPR